MLVSPAITPFYRSSVVFGVFLFIGTFFLATVSAYRPKLALLTIFATIILDVQCSYSPSTIIANVVVYSF